MISISHLDPDPYIIILCAMLSKSGLIRSQNGKCDQECKAHHGSCHTARHAPRWSGRERRRTLPASRAVGGTAPGQKLTTQVVPYFSRHGAIHERDKRTWFAPIEMILVREGSRTHSVLDFARRRGELMDPDSPSAYCRSPRSSSSSHSERSHNALHDL